MGSVTGVEILAYGVQTDEQPLLEQAFAGRHSLRTLAVFLDRDTAPLAAGYPAVSSSSVNAVLDAETLAVLAAGGTREFDFRLDGLLGRDVHGMTVGVIGTGKIGECFARIAAGFGTELLGWDISPDPACLALGMTYTDLPELLTRADLVSLHVPLVPATHHLIDAAALARMKDDAILVNSSRGGLVDSVALVETLRAGRLSGVGLDVYEEETGVFFTDRSIHGITDDTLARLVTFPQVLVTSHQAYFTRTAVGQIIDATARNVDDFAAGRTSENTLVPKS
ncbi:NAD(P)-dependent oxidoreductase [Streptomyces sp. 1114.5]|uniref:NAD(P)-dependent oxidoreductase n=1 Tax=Streptomyces sp. 1114.5 TaxID=1938830 RepID=UPI001600FC84|nr:NAD(P)-dependent oxidoreductase [Streptomyces sp. 1114.5]